MPLFAKPLISIALLAVLVGVFLFQQRRLTQANTYLKQAQSQIEVLQSKVDQAQHAVQTVTKYIDRVRVVRERGATLIQQVPNYVSEKDNAACVLSYGVIRLHNTAASQMPVADTGFTDAPPSNVALSTFASTVAGNYSRCHENAEQLIALQKLVTPLRLSSYEEQDIDGHGQRAKKADAEEIFK